MCTAWLLQTAQAFKYTGDVLTVPAGVTACQKPSFVCRALQVSLAARRPRCTLQGLLRSCKHAELAADGSQTCPYSKQQTMAHCTSRSLDQGGTTRSAMRPQSSPGSGFVCTSEAFACSKLLHQVDAPFDLHQQCKMGVDKHVQPMLYGLPGDVEHRSDTHDHSFAKVGGQAVFPGTSLPSELLQTHLICQSCGKRMTLVVQVGSTQSATVQQLNLQQCTELQPICTGTHAFTCRPSGPCPDALGVCVLRLCQGYLKLESLFLSDAVSAETY